MLCDGKTSHIGPHLGRSLYKGLRKRPKHSLRRVVRGVKKHEVRLDFESVFKTLAASGFLTLGLKLTEDLPLEILARHVAEIYGE